MSRAFVKPSPPSFLLEADVLKSFRSRAIELGCPFVLSAPGREVAARDPRGSAVASRPELGEASLRRGKRGVGLVEAVLLEQRAAKYELRAAHLVDVIHAAG